jgi:protein-disulfide isomerase
MKKALVIALLIGGFAAFIIGMLLTHAQPEAASAPMPTRDKLVRAHSPMLGNPAAPVVIVEFLDPACETCRDFYAPVKSLLNESQGRIALVVRYAPFHRGSDRIVGLLDAARRQGQFWPVLDALMASQDQWVIQHQPQLELAIKQLRNAAVQLDWNRLQADMNSAEARAVVEQDLADASALQVSKTPEFFVNGRPLPTFGWEPLQKLVHEELLRSATR